MSAKSLLRPKRDIDVGKEKYNDQDDVDDSEDTVTDADINQVFLLPFTYSKIWPLDVHAWQSSIVIASERDSYKILALWIRIKWFRLNDISLQQTKCSR